MSQRTKRILKVLASAFTLWVLFLALLPSILSHGGAQYYLSKKLPGKLTFQKAKISWFKAQTLKKVTYKSSDELLTFELDTFKTSASLFNLIVDSKNLKEVFIEGLKGDYDLTTQSKVASTSLNSDNKNEKPAFFILQPKYLGKLHLNQSSFCIKAPDTEPVHLKSIQLNCNMSDKKGPFFISLSCETSQKDLTGSIYLNSELGGFASDGRLVLTPYDKDIFFLSPKGYLDIDCQVNNLPSSGLDTIAQTYFPSFTGIASDLIGSTLNFGTQLHFLREKSNIAITADSQNIDLNFKGKLTNNVFSIDETSLFKLSLTPYLSKKLSQRFQKNIVIEKNAQASIQFDRLSFPMTSSSLDLKALSCNLRFAIENVDFSTDSIFKNLCLTSASAVLDSFDMSENTTLHCKVIGHLENEPVVAKLDGQFNKLQEIKSFSHLSDLAANLQLHMESMPSYFASVLFHSSKKASEFFGPTFDLQASLNGSLNKGELTASLKSPRFNIDSLRFNLDNKSTLKLEQSADLNFKVHPALATLVIHPNFKLLHPFEATGKLKKLDLDFHSLESLIEDIELKLHIEPFETNYLSSKPIHIADVNLAVFKNTEDEIQTDAFFTATVPQEYESSILGDFFDFSLIFKKGNLFSLEEPSQILGYCKNKHFETQFDGILNSSFVYKTTKAQPIYFQPTTFQTAKGTFASNERSTLVIQPYSFDFKKDAENISHLKGEFQLPSLSYSYETFTQNFKEVALPFALSFQNHSVDFELIAANPFCNFKGSMHTIKLLPYLCADFTVKGKCKLNNPAEIFNSSPLNSLFSQHPLSIHLSSSGKVDSLLEAQLSLECTSPSLHAKGVFAFDHEFYLIEPLNLRCSLTASQLEALTHQKLAPQVKNSELRLTLNRLHYTTLSKNFLPEHFQGDLHLDHLTLPNSQLKDILLSLERFESNEPVQFKLKGQTIGHKKKKGDFLAHGSVSSLSTKSLTLYNLQTSLTAHHLHLSLIEDLLHKHLPHNFNLVETFGPIANISSSIDFNHTQGHLEVDIDSCKLKGDLSFALQDNKLTLDQPSEIQFKFNENISELFLTHLNPFLSLTNSAQSAFSLFLPENSLSIRLDNPLKHAVIIDQAQVNLGKITLRNTQTVSEVLNLFDAETRKSSINAWIAPITFSYQNLNWSTTPSHMLLKDHFHLAVMQDQNNPEAFTLVLPNQTLKNHFQLKKLPSQYQIDLPLGCEFNQLKASLELAHTEIDSLFQRFSPLVNNQLSTELSSNLADKQQLLDSTSLPWNTPEEDSLSPKDEESTELVLQSFFNTLKQKFRSSVN